LGGRKENKRRGQRKVWERMGIEERNKRVRSEGRRNRRREEYSII
jgi:hypothetical protein